MGSPQHRVVGFKRVSARLNTSVDLLRQYDGYGRFKRVSARLNTSVDRQNIRRPGQVSSVSLHG